MYCEKMKVVSVEKNERLNIGILSKIPIQQVKYFKYLEVDINCISVVTFGCET